MSAFACVFYCGFLMFDIPIYFMFPAFYNSMRILMHILTFCLVVCVFWRFLPTIVYIYVFISDMLVPI